MEIGFILIYDNTAEAKIVFATESVKDALGFEPHELIGKDGYYLLHPEERKTISIVHTANVKNEKMSSFSTYKCMCKDGSYIVIDSAVNYCYDCLIVTNFVINSEESIRHKIRNSSADEVFTIQPDGSVELLGNQDQSKSVLEYQNAWNQDQKVDQLKQEHRFCLILNRFTNTSKIVFATRMCEPMVNLNQIECIGHSIYEYVTEEDKANVYEMIESSKKNSAIGKFRFRWLNSKDSTEDIPLETVLTCSRDGLVLVMRHNPTSIYSS